MAVFQTLVLLATVTWSDLAIGQVYNGYINPLFLPRGQRRGRLYDPNVGDLGDDYLLYRGGDYRRLSLAQDYRYNDRRYQRPYDSDRRYSSLFDSGRRYPNPYDIGRRYPSLYDTERSYQSPYYSDRRYLSLFDGDQRRYSNSYDGYRRYSNSYDGYRRYPAGFEGRFNDLSLEDNRMQYPSDVGIATTAMPLDRGQLQDRGLGFRETVPRLYGGATLSSRGLGLERGVGLGSNRDQGVPLDGLESSQGLDRGQILSTSSPVLSVSVDPNSTA